MSAAVQKKVSGWRWVWGFVFIFLAHVALVFRYNERSKLPVPPDRIQPLIYLASDPIAENRAADLGDRDPTLFALPNERGFSGDAWLSFMPKEIESSDWTSPPSWLPLPAGELGAPILAMAATNRVPAEGLLEDLRGVTPFELRIPAEIALPKSKLVIEGPLAGRLAWTNDLPVATNAELLTNTVLEVSVNGNGVVESVALMAECGLKSMDESAAELARRFSFKPLPLPWSLRDKASPVQGRLTFTWRVVPPPVTNSLTAATP